uniref:Uncharacterized protein n=1 Tax=Rhizophora mucronata TaxID=61149 RepID=A0A2P2NIE9_RHIMU
MISVFSIKQMVYCMLFHFTQSGIPFGMK